MKGWNPKKATKRSRDNTTLLYYPYIFNLFFFQLCLFARGDRVLVMFTFLMSAYVYDLICKYG